MNGEIRSPLKAITYLKKVCGHLSIISTKLDEVTWVSRQIEYIDKEQLIKDSERKGSKTIEWRDQIAVESNHVLERSVRSPVAHPYKT